MTPILEGSQVRLEPLRRDHFKLLLEVALDARIWRYLVNPVRSPEELTEWIDTALRLSDAGSTLIWVTVRKSSGRIVGSTRFTDLDLHHRTAEIGYTWLAPDAQGTGLNTEAKYLQLRFGFDALQLNRMAFRIHHENTRSQAAVRALGAVYEGTFRNHYIMPDGTLRHSAWFSITREEWPSVKSRLEARLALPASA